jgi:LacI family transcriptional regulator
LPIPSWHRCHGRRCRCASETALEFLAQRIAGTRAGAGTTAILEPRLIVRNSCAAPALGAGAEAVE